MWFSLAKLGKNIAHRTSSATTGLSGFNKDTLLVSVHTASIEWDQRVGLMATACPYVQLELLDKAGQKLPGVRKSIVGAGASPTEPVWEQEVVLGSECILTDAVYLRARGQRTPSPRTPPPRKTHTASYVGRIYSGVLAPVLDKHSKETLGLADIPLDPAWQVRYQHSYNNHRMFCMGSCVLDVGGCCVPAGDPR